MNNSSKSDQSKPGRKATGTIITLPDGRYQAVVTLADGRRKRIPPFPKGTSLEMAREKAAHYAERVKELGLESAAPRVPASLKSSCETWVEAWHAARVAKGYTSARLGLGHWKGYLSATLGKKHPKHWTRDDFRQLSKSLDDKVNAGSLSWKSAANIWGTATQMADEAVESKDEKLRCRTDNPSDGVRGPDRGEKVAKQYLYPSEFLQLMTCETVPLEWRRTFAIAVYSYARLGELLALTWNDVDLLHCTISITRAVNTVTGETKTTKSKAPRRIAIEQNLLPLLVAMHAECNGKGPVVRFPTVEHQAVALRDFLKVAGVNRTSLFTAGPSVKPIRFHDLRATGLTWMAVRGDEPLRIMQRAGHSSFATTQIYIREAESHGPSFGQPFPTLPATLLVGESLQAIDRSPVVEMTKADVFSAGLSFSSVGHEGLEPELVQGVCEVRRENKGVHGPGSLPESEAKSADAGPDRLGFVTESDPVEAALAVALEGATKAGEWSTVAQLARELEARRQARSAVVDLNVERAKRGAR